MVTNPDRRIALLDAALDVLAEEGARGLTFRRLDERAEVPRGTASNYFASRDDLLTQFLAAGRRLHVEPPAEEPGLDDLSVVRVVVDHQDPLPAGYARWRWRFPQVFTSRPEPMNRSTSATTRRGSHGFAR
jgi:AcrR family transcriptional regulator